jgi:hypothetical protein
MTLPKQTNEKSLSQAKDLMLAIPACNPLDTSDLGQLLRQIGQLRGSLREDTAEVEDYLCGMAERLVAMIERHGHISGRQALTLVVEVVGQVVEALSIQASEDVGTDGRTGAHHGSAAARTGQAAQNAPPPPSTLGLRLMDHRKIGEILVSLSMLTQDQVERALKHQKANGKRLGETLVELNYITKSAIESALRIQRKNQGARMGDPWSNR